MTHPVHAYINVIEKKRKKKYIYIYIYVDDDF
jgi:hypothetical protein